MRKLFADPNPFIDEAVKLAVQNNYDGYNLDFEPRVNINTSDAVFYARFIDTFAKRLHQVKYIFQN